MKKILMAIVGLLLIYPIIVVSGVLQDYADTHLSLNVYGEFFFGVLPFVIIGVGILAIFKAINHLRSKE